MNDRMIQCVRWRMLSRIYTSNTTWSTYINLEVYIFTTYLSISLSIYPFYGIYASYDNDDMMMIMDDDNHDDISWSSSTPNIVTSPAYIFPSLVCCMRWSIVQLSIATSIQYTYHPYVCLSVCLSVIMYDRWMDGWMDGSQGTSHAQVVLLLILPLSHPLFSWWLCSWSFAALVESSLTW